MSAHAKSPIPVLSAVEGRFTPVQLKARHDGWSPARQRRFIDTLAATRSIAAACRAVGMTRASAYKLREKDCRGQSELATREKDCRGQSEHATRDRDGPDNGFAQAWERALRFDPFPAVATVAQGLAFAQAHRGEVQS